MEKVILHSKSNASIKRDQCVYELVFKLGEDISRQIRLEQEAFYSNFLAQQKKLCKIQQKVLDLWARDLLPMLLFFQP